MPRLFIFVETINSFAMKKLAFLFLAFGILAAPLTSCKKDDPVKKDTTEEQKPGESSGQGSGTTTASMPDCFVYYKGATFIFKRTLDSGTSSKITWVVTDYNNSTKTATVQETAGDNAPTTFQIRKGSKCIEFNKSGSWKPLTDGGTEINFMNGSALNSIPSGIYGSVNNNTKVESVNIPGGKTSAGFSISSSYQPYSGMHDSFLFDYSSGESWSTECGFVSSGYWYQNGKEYPIYTMRTTVELVAYDIPMPDGTRRSYAPAGSTVYDVTDTNFSCYQNDYRNQRYACIFGYWNDKKNTNVMRYQLCVLWYDNGWTYGQVTNDLHKKWELSCWFAGKAYSGKAIGGAYDGESFDCEGHYSSFTGSQSYSPFDQAGYYTFFVLAENAISVGEPTLDDTVFCLLYIPNDGSASSTYSARVKPLEDGTVGDYYAAPAKSGIGITPTIPSPDMIEGPIRKLNW